MYDEIKKQIGPAFSELESAIALFSDENFNKVPFEGSWTAGQVVRHIKLSAGSIFGLLEGNTEAPDRGPDEKVKMIADIFLNFDSKMQSPDFILPEMKEYRKEPFVEWTKEFSGQMENAAETLDLDQVCLDFALPNMGKFTRLEFIAFVLFHTQRHTHQLKKIAEVFATANA